MSDQQVRESLATLTKDVLEMDSRLKLLEQQTAIQNAALSMLFGAVGASREQMNEWTDAMRRGDTATAVMALSKILNTAHLKAAQTKGSA